MPIYEYECPVHGRFEWLRPVSASTEDSKCPSCGHLAKRIMSPAVWKMGWNFLRNKSEGSPPAPEDAGYHPEWDQAYKGSQVLSKVRPIK